MEAEVVSKFAAASAPRAEEAAGGLEEEGEEEEAVDEKAEGADPSESMFSACVSRDKRLK